VCVYICVFVFTCVCWYVSLSMCVCVCVCVCVHFLMADGCMYVLEHAVSGSGSGQVVLCGYMCVSVCVSIIK